jgi:hypothetical protein
MPVDINFTDHSSVLLMVSEAQDAESDMRDASREAKLFITKRDGQWDPYAVEKMGGRFRGTFDMCTPIVDQISGEIDQSDFTLRVSPSGGEASEDTAKTLDGLIRNIRNISNAENVFQAAGRSNVIGGFDCWEVVQDWVDGDSFDQDLFIRRVPDAVNSVWFDLGSVMQDRSDAQWGVKLKTIPTATYKKKWPEGSALSVGDDKTSEAYTNKAESVVVGQLYYRKPVTIEIVRMTDGSVYKDDDKFQKVKDDLALQNITEEKRRKRKSWRVHSRMFDGGDWLAEDEETVFDYIPLIPVYGNFDIIESKTIYYGKIEKLYDEQRSLNYAMSRDIEDGALSPSPTVWMTEAMAEGGDYSKMNTDRAPIRTFVPDPNFPGLTPQFTGGPQPSAGLQTTIGNMQQMIGASANIFLAQQGNAAPAQSGIAGAQQIDQGNIGAIKWFKPLEVAICHTGKILINAIPRVYDSTRQVRILEEDGTGSMVTLNQTVFDQQSGTNVELNNLTIGEYDVVCDVGPAFNSQQKETAQAFLDMATIDPTTAERNKDIWLRNLQIPGMDMAAEREREFLFNNGVIPESQWTDEEKQKVAEQQQQAQANPPPEDPNLMIGQAELLKAQTEAQSSQFDQQVKGIELQQAQQKLDQEGAKISAEAQNKDMSIMLQNQKQQMDILTSATDQMAKLSTAFGIDSIAGAAPANIIVQQGGIIDEAQDRIK